MTKHKILAGIVLIVSLVGFSGRLYSETLRLKNGDVISGKVIRDQEDKIIFEHPILGQLTIPKNALLTEKDENETKASTTHIDWQRKIGLGFNEKRGNINSTSVSTDIFINRRTSSDETTFKARACYSSKKGEMEDRKLYSLLRYAYSFGRDLKWYQFVKLEFEHSRFSDVKYQLLPSIGLGRWFSDSSRLKLMVEASIGEEITSYYSQDEDSKIVANITGFLSKEIRENLLFSQNLTFYPSFESAQYRIRSETELTIALSKPFSLNFVLIDEYNSCPSSGQKANDLQLLWTLEWNF